MRKISLPPTPGEPHTADLQCCAQTCTKTYRTCEKGSSPPSANTDVHEAVPSSSNTTTAPAGLPADSKTDTQCAEEDATSTQGPEATPVERACGKTTGQPLVDRASVSSQEERRCSIQICGSAIQRGDRHRLVLWHHRIRNSPNPFGYCYNVQPFSHVCRLLNGIHVHPGKTCLWSLPVKWRNYVWKLKKVLNGLKSALLRVQKFI
eukprot:4878445-Amphidinium_carterae.1